MGGGREQTRQIPGILPKAADGVLGALEQVAPVGVEGGEVGFVEDLICGGLGGEMRDVKGRGGEGVREWGVTESVPPTQKE